MPECALVEHNHFDHVNATLFVQILPHEGNLNFLHFWNNYDQLQSVIQGLI